MAPARHRCLLLTFDAFSTLFHPRRSIPETYSSVAHSYGLIDPAIAPARLQEAFKNAYKAQSKAYPNYGRDQVLRGEYGGPRQWWSSVIASTFANALDKQDLDIPSEMIENLIETFAGRKGYTLYDDVMPCFAQLRDFKAGQSHFNYIVTGVISNSDDRVSSVLKSLGLAVGNTRADKDRSSTQLPGFEESVDEGLEKNGAHANDLDLIITSYEAGEEKPSNQIFEVAERQARRFLSTKFDSSRKVDDLEWTRIHIGDDFVKDYQGALNAGWHGILLERDNASPSHAKDAKTIASLKALLPEIERYTNS